MSAKDIVTKNYMKDGRRFADAFNYYLFDGEPVIHEEELCELDPVELGILLGDVYGDSIEFLSGFGRNDKLKPVITLVIYWNEGPWDGPRSLYDMIEPVDDRIKEYVNDYKLHVIVPDEIEDFRKFRTELGQALEFISISSREDKIEELQNDMRFASVSNETVHLLNVCTGADMELDEERGVVDMCKGIEDLKRREWTAGKVEGKLEGKLEGELSGQKKEFVNAIERVAKNSGGISVACTLYGTTEEEYWRVKNSLVLI